MIYRYIINFSSYLNYVNFSWDSSIFFRFAEGKSELVSEFNIEYKSSPFALIL